MRIRPLTASLLALLAPITAAAQEPAGPGETVPPQPSQVVVGGAGARSAPTSQCLHGYTGGIPEADARTSVTLVCTEIARIGPAPDMTYRVAIGKLGSVYILSLTAERPAGVVHDSRQVQLSSIEEVPVAAPRLAESLLRGTTLQQTQKVDNVVGAEARLPKKQTGTVRGGIGVFGMLPPLGEAGTPAAGMSLPLMYETTSAAVGVDLRLASGGPSGMRIAMFSTSLGGRYYLSDTAVSPFVGGGLGLTYLKLRSDASRFNGDKTGIGAYAEVGLEVLRTHKSQLAIKLGIDLPFYAIDNDVDDGKSSQYYAPITIGAVFKLP